MVLILTLVILLKEGVVEGSWESFKKSYNESYDRAFIKRFRTNFIQSCRGGYSSDTIEKVCECCADQAIAQLTVKQLQDKAFVNEYIGKNIVSSCVDKYKN